MEEDLSLRYDNGTGEQAPGGAEAPGGGLSSVHQRPQPHGFLVQLHVQDEALAASLGAAAAPCQASWPRLAEPRSCPRHPLALWSVLLGAVLAEPWWAVVCTGCVLHAGPARQLARSDRRPHPHVRRSEGPIRPAAAARRRPRRPCAAQPKAAPAAAPTCDLQRRRGRSGRSDRSDGTASRRAEGGVALTACPQP